MEMIGVMWMGGGSGRNSLGRGLMETWLMRSRGAEMSGDNGARNGSCRCKGPEARAWTDRKPLGLERRK